MKPFSAPLEEILFSLKHIAKAEEIPGWDHDFTNQIGVHFATFAENEIAPLNASGDRQGCRIENGRVRMPDGFCDVYRSYAEQGWPGLSAPEQFGGQNLGELTLAVISEIFAGANHSLQMVTGLVPGAIRTLMRFGTDEQKSRFIPQLVSGTALATMCLTESGAGSDLSRIGCRAELVAGTWRITGEKIFISGGDQDLSKDILHLVLARTSDEGVRGLSLFLCPSLGADFQRNAVSVARIEEKMGLHASPTCHLIFDSAEAELMGSEGQGLAAMFTLMNYARLDVALQGTAHAARASDIAASYAATRIQGRNNEGAEAFLDSHSDVRRMLDEIDAMALGGRAMTHISLVEMEKGDEPALVDFLTPVCKVYGTWAGVRASEIGMQVLGGYGYLREYQLEQIYRDARVTAIYEGTNGIHARTLISRYLHGSEGTAFERFVKLEVEKYPEVKVISEIFEVWKAVRETLRGVSDRSQYAHDFMSLTINTMLACVWARFRSSAGNHAEANRISRLSFRQLKRISAKAPAMSKLLLS